LRLDLAHPHTMLFSSMTRKYMYFRKNRVQNRKSHLCHWVGHPRPGWSKFKFYRSSYMGVGSHCKAL